MTESTDLRAELNVANLEIRRLKAENEIISRNVPARRMEWLREVFAGGSVSRWDIGKELVDDLQTVIAERDAAVDALHQWSAAQGTGDLDELRNARAARDEVLRKAGRR